MNDTVDTLFQGRVRPLQGKTIRLFGSVATPTPVVSSWITPTSTRGYWTSPCDCVGCGATMITAAVVEILRNTDESPPLAPLEISDFADHNALPAGATRVRGRSQVKMRVSAELATTSRQFLMDVGQTIEVNAECVCVEFLVPNNFYEVFDGTGQRLDGQTVRSGLVLDVMLSVAIARIETGVGATEAIFTSNHFVLASTQPTIVIPPFARDVTIYQTPAGSASAMWTQWYGDPAVTLGSIQAGVLPWRAGLRRTEQESVLPDATHLRPDVDDADRFFTLRWSIRP